MARWQLSKDALPDKKTAQCQHAHTKPSFHSNNATVLLRSINNTKTTKPQHLTQLTGTKWLCICCRPLLTISCQIGLRKYRVSKPRPSASVAYKHTDRQGFTISVYTNNMKQANNCCCSSACCVAV